MNTLEAAPSPGHAAPTIVERATAILRDEIAGGALSNIAESTRVWAENRRGLFSSQVIPRMRADLEALLEPVLDLLAPPTTVDPRVEPAVTGPGNERTSGPHSIDAFPVLRSPRSGSPGHAAEIRTHLRNDGPRAVEVGFVCSDLINEAARRIPGDCVWLHPRQPLVPPGGVVELVIGLDVPVDAIPGLYHALLQATELPELGAVLKFPVG
jgi:hypothetical protein